MFGCQSVYVRTESLCVDRECLCTPSVKAYRLRRVHDVYHDTVLMYVKYQCEGVQRRCFFTVSAEYMETAGAGMDLLFPYALTAKEGMSRALMDLAHVGTMPPSGLSSVLHNIQRKRHKRFYKLRALHAVSNAEGKSVVTPCPPSIEEYDRDNCVPDHQCLTDLWLTHTIPHSLVAEALMRSLGIEQVLQLDHSQKFCQCLKKHGAHGAKASLADIRMILLMQNEIGEIVGRTLTMSETTTRMSGYFGMLFSPASASETLRAVP